MAVVRAFKYLRRGAHGRFSNFVWPRGEWVEASEPVVRCARGIHACRLSDLPHWIDDELWHIELDGSLSETATMLIASRARLLAPVPGWQRTKQELGAYCLERTRAFSASAREPALENLAQRYLRDVESLLSLGMIATAAYVSAVSARCASELDEVGAYAWERSVQASWLAERIS
jgi:hypothetical protein